MRVDECVKRRGRKKVRRKSLTKEEDERQMKKRGRRN